MSGNAHDDADGVSRRDFARLGLFAGGVALTAPSIRTISFAGKVVVSVHTPPSSTTPTSATAPTSATTPGSSTPVTAGGGSVTSTSSTSASSTTTTANSAANDGGGNGALPLTGAAIGGLAVVGGAAIAAGRAMSAAGKPTPPDEVQSPLGDDGA